MRQYALSDARASCRLKKLKKLFLSPRCDACLWPRTQMAESGLQGQASPAVLVLSGCGYALFTQRQDR